MSQQIIYVMGVSGCGKSTIGKMLSERLDIPFYDGDDFHPKENIEKMSSGQALNDNDRWPWLETIQAFAAKQIKTQSVIIACSALKESYREILMKDLQDQCLWVHLHGNFDLILQRINDRKGHFLPPALLVSQFDTLETPTYGLHLNIQESAESIIDQIEKAYNKK